MAELTATGCSIESLTYDWPEDESGARGLVSQLTSVNQIIEFCEENSTL
jgi:hypothetical protein